MEQTDVELDYDHLDKLLDRTKLAVFQSPYAGFIGSLMCSCNFAWIKDIPTAATTGMSIYWNPNWFLSLPDSTRVTILVHEIWHIALQHCFVRGDRDPKLWNYAADVIINNMLHRDGFSFQGTRPWMSLDYDESWYTEKLYDEFKAMQIELPDDLWGVPDAADSDLMEEDTLNIFPESMTQAEIVANIMVAQMSARMAGASDGTPEVGFILKRFLEPKLPWEELFYDFFNEQGGHDFSWSRRNRRYREVYLPGDMETNDALSHVMFFQDASGSVSDGDLLRMNSEVKHIWESFEPKKLTIVMFDDQITATYEFNEGDTFEEVPIVGRGGTDLAPVRDYIIEHEPTAVVVFSDFYCDPMEALPEHIQIPFLWVGVNASQNTQIPCGRIIHIRE